MFRNHLLLILFAATCLLTKTVCAQTTSTLQLYFESDSFNLPEKEKEKLSAFIKNADSLVLKNISVLAWCDDVGDTEYNAVLSAKRAQQVKTLLVAQKIDSNLITDIQGKGELPLNTNTTEAEQQRLQNRRAELRFTFEKKEKPKTEQTNLFSDSLKVGDKITLSNILFVPGRHELLPESYFALERLLKTVKEKSHINFIINGHICCVPPGEEGVDHGTGIRNLSEARAKAIYDYLIKNGVKKERLSYKGLRADFKTGKGEKYDRRVEIEISSINNN
jgi:outer membrane protein OmpA-like peptidoglycan-associated protein